MTIIKKTAKLTVLGVALLGLGAGVISWTNHSKAAEEHYWYVKNSSNQWVAQNTVPTEAPSSACPLDEGEPCAKGFDLPQNPNTITDETIAQRELFKAE